MRQALHLSSPSPGARPDKSLPQIGPTYDRPLDLNALRSPNKDTPTSYLATKAVKTDELIFGNPLHTESFFIRSFSTNERRYSNVGVDVEGSLKLDLRVRIIPGGNKCIFRGHGEMIRRNDRGHGDHGGHRHPSYEFRVLRWHSRKITSENFSRITSVSMLGNTRETIQTKRPFVKAHLEWGV